MRGGFSAIGPRLIAKGFAAIPVMPGTKRPGYKRGGEWIGISDWHDKYSRRLPSEFEINSWSASEAGVCVVCGGGSRDLVAIDIDTDEPDIIDALNAILPETEIVKRGQKGETRFYRAPGLELERGKSSFNLTDPAYAPPGHESGKRYRVVDIIGEGRQTVLPPTIHPDTGEPYEWIGDIPLEDAEPDDIPLLPPDIADRIAEALAPFGYEEPKFEPLSSGGEIDGDKPHRLLNEESLAKLDAWVPKLGLYKCRRTRDGYEAVATWRASNSGNPIGKRKLNLKIHRGGIRDFGDDRGYTPLDLVMASQGCDLDTAFHFLTSAVGWSPITDPILIGPRKAKEEAPGHTDLMVTPESLDEYLEENPPPAIKPPLPVEDLEPFRGLTDVPGVLGDCVDWIAGTARRPNRVLALGAAIGVIGTLIGRRVATPTTAGTHLYTVALAPTGAGKQHPLSCAMRLMKAAGAGHHIGPSEFVSMPAVINFLQRMPLSLCPQDEFGAFLKRVNSRRASGFEASISKALRSAWGASFEAFVTPEWAGRVSQTIFCPAISIYGLSTPEEFYDALQGEDVTNGFLNRFLVLSTRERAAEVETTDLEPREVPDGLKLALETLYNWSGDRLGTARLNDPTLDPDPDKLPWADDNARVVYRDLARHIEKEMDAVPELEPFIARTAEIALRLATIRAAGRWAKGAAVKVDDMEWGAAVALASANMVAGDATRRMVVEMSHGKITNRLLDILRKRKGRAKRRDLQRAIGNGVKPRDFNDALKALEESGQIESERVIPPAGGPPTIWFCLTT